MSELVFSTIHGFADLSDASLVAENPAQGLSLAKISDNAAFGIVRMEVFSGTFKHGDVVPIPQSPTDNYIYSRNELMYIWAPISTGDNKTQWASNGPPWTCWYAAFSVDQLTGTVACAMGYRGNQDHTDRQNKTNDGTLQVWTIAQRQLSSLVLAAKPSFVNHADGEFVTDAALTQQILQEMNRSAKMGVVNQEAIYMGVFKNGDTVPKPVSPADGYAYSYAEVAFQTSLFWTADDDGATPANMVIPPLTKGQLDDWQSSVNAATGVVSITITYESFGSHTYNTGRIAVFAFCQRAQCVVPGTAIVWDPTLAGNAALPYGDQTRWGTAPVVIARNLVPGASITLQAVGLVAAGAVPWAFNSPAGGSYTNGVVTDTIPNLSFKFPLEWVPGYTSSGGNSSTPIGIVGLMGAFTDGAGVVKGSPLAIGLGGTFVVPAGATQLQLGINDNIPNDNQGSFAVSVVPLLAAANPTFVEIDSSTFMPGQTLRASTMLTLMKNIRAALLLPEIFGPTSYTDGQTITLPTSPLDGYVYSLAECTFLWDWVNTGPSSVGYRMVMSTASVDASGVVHLTNYRFPGSASTYSAIHNGTVRVIIFAKRNHVYTTPVAPPAQPVTGTTPDDSSGAITVNGV
jgi:hypothetical protein